MSRRDRAALCKRVDSSHSQRWLIHLFLPFTLWNHFDTLSVCLTPTSCGRFMSSRLPPRSLSLCSHGRECSAWKYARLFQLDCAAISQGRHFLFIVSAFLAPTRGHGNLPVALHFFFLSFVFFPCSSFSIFLLETADLPDYICFHLCSTLLPAAFHSTYPTSDCPLCRGGTSRKAFFKFSVIQVETLLTPRVQRLSRSGHPHARPPCALNRAAARPISCRQ